MNEGLQNEVIFVRGMRVSSLKSGRDLICRSGIMRQSSSFMAKMADPIKIRMSSACLSGFREMAMAESKYKIRVTGKFPRMARIEKEWYEDVETPEAIVTQLKKDHLRADIFTFWQRLPKTTRIFPYHMEWEAIAALPVKSHDYWLKSQVDSNVRRALRRSAKAGVIVKRAEWTADFVQGMTKVFNESPVRQGRPFLHYGKDQDTIKREFSRYLFREELIGAYFDGNLIGFVMLAYAGEYALLGQIISMIAHRDKSVNNALIGKAVEVCAEKGISYLVYFSWGRGSLQEFKRRNGFQKVDLPRYYIPLNLKGRIAMKFGLHRRLSEYIPDGLFERLVGLRSKWYKFRYSNLTF